MSERMRLLNILVRNRLLDESQEIKPQVEKLTELRWWDFMDLRNFSYSAARELCEYLHEFGLCHHELEHHLTHWQDGKYRVRTDTTWVESNASSEESSV